MLIFCIIFFFIHVRILKAVGCFFSNDNEPLFYGTDAGQKWQTLCVYTTVHVCALWKNT